MKEMTEEQRREWIERGIDDLRAAGNDQIADVIAILYSSMSAADLERLFEQLAARSAR